MRPNLHKNELQEKHSPNKCQLHRIGGREKAEKNEGEEKEIVLNIHHTPNDYNSLEHITNLPYCS